MDDVVELGMEAAQNHEKIMHPQQMVRDLKNKKKEEEDQHKRRQQERRNGYSRHDQFDGRTERDRRDHRGRDQELPLGGYARRPGMNRRVSSLDRDKFDRRRRYSDSGASTDIDPSEISSCEDDKEVRHMKGREIITAGLATVATLHAGKKVYDSFGATHKRHKAVRQGKITQEEADRKKHKSRIFETAGIGLAALGLKGVYDEWKEVRESHKEYEGTREKRERHRRKQGKVASGSRGGGRHGDGRGESGSESESLSRSGERYGDGGGDLSRRQTTYDGDGRGDRYGDWDGRMNQYADGRMNQYVDGRMNQYADGRMNQYGDGRVDQYGDGRMTQYGDGRMNQYGNGSGGDYRRRRSVPNMRD